MRTLPLIVILGLAACNAPPEGGAVSVLPEFALTTDDLVATVTDDSVDPNGKEVTYTYAWTVDGAASDVTADTVPAASTRKGEVWEVTVTPTDGKKIGNSFVGSTTVLNSPPVVSNLAISPGDVRPSETLTATFDGFDADDDIVETTITWKADGVDAGTGRTLSTAGMTRGTQITVTVVPNDGEVSGVPVTAGPVSILNTPPTAPVAVIEPGEPSVGSDLQCTVGTAASDADGDTLSTSASWTVDGAAYRGTVTQTVFPGDTVPSASTEEGQVWRCTLTVSDGEDTASSAPSAPVTVTAPDNVSFRAGYYWVIADYPAQKADHGKVCESVGLVATEEFVTLTWDADLMANLSADFGYVNAGDTDCCAEAMWCFDGGDSEVTSALDGECETHNFGTRYWNYGVYRTGISSHRPVFTCVEPS